MLANNILKLTLAPFRCVLVILSPITTFLIDISFVIPFWVMGYRLMMKAIWFPCGQYIKRTSTLYEEKPEVAEMLYSKMMRFLESLGTREDLLEGWKMKPNLER